MASNFFASPYDNPERGRRVSFLKKCLDARQAQQRLGEFPTDLVVHACRELVPSEGVLPIDEILAKAQEHPHLALCMVEEGLPPYLAKLAHIEQEARLGQQRLRRAAHRAFSTSD